MPTLDDLPIMPAIGTSTLAAGDLIPVLDVGGSGSSQVRKATVAEVGEVTAAAILAAGTYPLAGLGAAETVIDTDGGTIAPKRLVVITGGTTSAVTLQPPATATIKEVYIMNGGSGNCSVGAASNCIIGQGALTPSNASTVATTGNAHFMCDGTYWYRLG